MNALVFQSTRFDITDRNGLPWIRGYQIGTALDYSDGDVAIRKIFKRHADEFTDSMTAVVKLPTAGGEQETRIFSLRGAHLLAMFARTKVAAEFRRWVLDILDGIQPAQPALPLCITNEQAGEISTLVALRFPDGKDRPYAWSRFNNHFRLDSYKHLPMVRYDEAIEYVNQMPVKSQHAQDMVLVPKNAVDVLVNRAGLLKQQWQALRPLVAANIGYDLVPTLFDANESVSVAISAIERMRPAPAPMLT